MVPDSTEIAPLMTENVVRLLFMLLWCVPEPAIRSLVVRGTRGVVACPRAFRLGLFLLPVLSCFPVVMASSSASRAPASPSRRARSIDPPHIENVLDEFADIPDTYNLAMGVAHWGPPPNALKAAATLMASEGGQGLHGYGPIVGARPLVEAIKRKLREDNGLDLTNQEVMVTAGANQAITNVALALCDPGDEAVICAPCYYSHKLALQIAQANISLCRWDPQTLLPDLQHLSELLSSGRVKVVVLTTPGNPTGAVCPEPMLLDIVQLCKRHGSWLVLDQAYEHFLHDGARHTSICAEKVGYPGIIHIFSFSKSFGMAGWRVGYLVYPRSLHGAMRSLQDTIPTHAVMAAQQVALAALDDTDGQGGVQWARRQVSGLPACRERMWSVLDRWAPGTVRTDGAFYFLLQLPSHVSEADAVRVLATRAKVLVTPGSAFGAPGHLRVSYGSLPPAACMEAIDRLESGLKMLHEGSHQPDPVDQKQI